MQYAPDSAELFPASFSPHPLAAIETALESLPPFRAGARLRPIPGLADLVGPADRIAASILGPAARPVRAVCSPRTLIRRVCTSGKTNLATRLGLLKPQPQLVGRHLPQLSRHP